MKRFAVWLACILIFALAGLAFAAEIEKKSRFNGDKMELFWWPKLQIPKGWVHNEDASMGMSMNVLIPVGKTFADAPTVIYARAFYEPDKSKRGTLQQFIDSDIKGMRKEQPKFTVKELDSTPTAKGPMRTFGFATPGISYERVCYGQEGDFWTVFVISSKTDKDLEKTLPAFLKMMSTYR